jgi:hypothetical protein
MYGYYQNFYVPECAVDGDYNLGKESGAHSNNNVWFQAYGDYNLGKGAAVYSNNNVWVPVLIPFWGYPTTVDASDIHYKPLALDARQHTAAQGDEEIHRTEPVVEDASIASNPESRADASCDTSANNSDSYSDASTDVGDDLGDDDDVVDDLFEATVGPAPAECAQAVQSVAASSRPCLFAKVNRQQRAEQVRRVVEEFCSLEFDLVDVSCQEALVLRMMTILKSLSERTTYVGEHGCSEAATRFDLLGLSQDDEDAMKSVICHAEKLWTTRSFHAAFDVLKQVVPKLRGQSIEEGSLEWNQNMRPEEVEVHSEKMSPEEIEAMKLRRLEKRQRQRQERREQRNAERVVRSTQRYYRRPR